MNLVLQRGGAEHQKEDKAVESRGGTREGKRSTALALGTLGILEHGRESSVE